MGLLRAFWRPGVRVTASQRRTASWTGVVAVSSQHTPDGVAHRARSNTGTLALHHHIASPRGMGWLPQREISSYQRGQERGVSRVGSSQAVGVCLAHLSNPPLARRGATGLNPSGGPEVKIHAAQYLTKGRLFRGCFNFVPCRTASGPVSRHVMEGALG
ncbi:hypothetical protein BU23DRAFT_169614 [Bimuria novae-zelandiae CBS 107.79]|uniref:Uncharacterized protein n=1 Tax=Bimuria novae-zelandiae CBS 107.79 TaxID=1447943 RepID=A0A6A5V5S8_9PLEO|nr:hypothetical protein BU23DRAFT_169614 [Bimuria novae-zelandiae CBS 107.79]